MGIGGAVVRGAVIAGKAAKKALIIALRAAKKYGMKAARMLYSKARRLFSLAKAKSLAAGKYILKQTGKLSKYGGKALDAAKSVRKRALTFAKENLAKIRKTTTRAFKRGTVYFEKKGLLGKGSSYEKVLKTMKSPKFKKKVSSYLYDTLQGKLKSVADVTISTSVNTVVKDAVTKILKDMGVPKKAIDNAKGIIGDEVDSLKDSIKGDENMEELQEKVNNNLGDTDYDGDAAAEDEGDEYGENEYEGDGYEGDDDEEYNYDYYDDQAYNDYGNEENITDREAEEGEPAPTDPQDNEQEATPGVEYAE